MTLRHAVIPSAASDLANCCPTNREVLRFAQNDSDSLIPAGALLLLYAVGRFPLDVSKA